VKIVIVKLRMLIKVRIKLKYVIITQIISHLIT